MLSEGAIVLDNVINGTGTLASAAVVADLSNRLSACCAVDLDNRLDLGRDMAPASAVIVGCDVIQACDAMRT